MTEAPRAPEHDKFVVAPIAEGITRLELRFGFMEEPNIPERIAEAMASGRIEAFDLARAIYYTGHETIIPSGRRQACRDGARRCSPSCITMPSAPERSSESPARRSWRSGSNSRIRSFGSASITSPCLADSPAVPTSRAIEQARSQSGFNFRKGEETPMLRWLARLGCLAVRCAGSAGGGSSQDALLDLARVARRPGVDLLSRRRQHVGEGHRPDRQDLVPQRRRRRRSRRRSAPRSPPRRTPLSPPAPIRAASSMSSRRRAPRAFRSSTSTRRTPKVNFNAYVGGRSLGIVGKGWAQYLVDHGLVKVRRLRLDACRGSGRELRRRGGEGDRDRRSSRST